MPGPGSRGSKDKARLDVYRVTRECGKRGHGGSAEKPGVPRSGPGAGHAEEARCPVRAGREEATMDKHLFLVEDENARNEALAAAGITEHGDMLGVAAAPPPAD